MITKPLKDLEQDIKNYQEKLHNSETLEEENSIKNEFLNILKLYLFEANNIIKETFHTEITPFKKETGYNALYTGNVSSFTKKNKNEFFNEIDNLIKSASYASLNDDNKILADNAIYILKTYYEDSLI